MAQAHTNKRDSAGPNGRARYQQRLRGRSGTSPRGHGAHSCNQSSEPNHLNPTDNIYHPDFWNQPGNQPDESNRASKQARINSALADMLMATH